MNDFFGSLFVCYDKQMKKAVVIGFGRFGELLAKLGSSTFDISIVESNPVRARVAREQGYVIEPIDSAVNSDFIFLTVPISKIEPILIKLAPLVNNSHVVIDLCSVKVYPVDLMKKYLSSAQILGTHPMFGPDSAKKDLDGLQIAICPVNITPENLKHIKEFWIAQGVSVIETSPEDHDKDAVYSQAFTYLLAKVILNMNLPEVTFKTRSFDALVEVARLSANDSEQLFHDILFYNPYFSKMKAELEASIAKTNNVLNQIESERAEIK
jgi:prephenate dehydrogenase